MGSRSLLTSSWNSRRCLHPTGWSALFAIVLLMPALSTARANDLRIDGIVIDRTRAPGVLRVNAKVGWKNAWRNARNYDAVWLFVKVRPAPNAPWRHVRLAASPRVAATPLACAPSADGVGAFCRAAAESYRGDLAGDVVLEVDPASLPSNVATSPTLEARVFGIEMVYVPDGPFTVGDRDTASVSHAALYRSAAGGAYGGPYRITSEAAIRVAPEAGALYYHASLPQYQGDGLGPIPAAFPKGTRAFYIMKYEILQGQYADFLNTIGHYAASFRAPLGTIGYAEERGSIRIEGEAYVSAKPHRPA